MLEVFDTFKVSRAIETSIRLIQNETLCLPYQIFRIDCMLSCDKYMTSDIVI